MSDRIAGLLRHYALSARVFHSGLFCGSRRFDADPGMGYVHLIRRGPLEVRSPAHESLRIREPTLLFYPRPLEHTFRADERAGTELVCASLDLGAGASNPLALALPSMLCIPLDRMPRLGGTLELIFAEAFGAACGRQAAIDRLCEVLLIQVLRHVMDSGRHVSGMFAGMADRRLAKALTAMHDDVAREWTLQELAALAGMSRARFAARFRETLGTTAGQYLAGWRVGLAQALLKKGKPVGVVANEVGYGSTTSLSRAFRAHVGLSPTEWLSDSEGPMTKVVA